MIKKLLKSIREYKKPTILTPSFIVIEVIMETVIPLVMASLLDKGLEDSNIKMIFIYGVVLIFLSFISLIAGIISSKYSSVASSGFAKNLRKDVYDNVTNYSFNSIDKYSSSSIITRLTTDITNIQNSFQMCIRIAIRAPLMFLFSLIMTFTISYKIAFIFLIVIPIVFTLLLLIAKIAHPYFEKVFKTYDEINNVVKENVNGIRVVKSYVQEENEIKKFNIVSQKIYNLFTKAEKIVCSNSAIMDCAMYLCILLISFIGAKSIVAGTLTTGKLTSLLTYTITILISLMMISMCYVMIIISLPSMKRVVELLDEKTDIENPKNGLKTLKDGSIEFKNVDFSYTKNQKSKILNNINLSIKSGQTIGIIGGTGSGKSSFVNLIPRLYDVTSGQVLVGGNNVKKYDLKALRDNVSMVLQKNVLFTGTIKDNLKWGNKKATEQQMKKVCKIACIDDFIESLPEKYDYMITKGGNNVSGGQKQRLCIARALLKNPKIIIFDDSTSACDMITDRLIRKQLKKCMPDVTKIIITQRVDSVLDADKVIVFENGKVVDYDTPKKLLKTSKIFKEVYTSQKGGEK